MARDITSSSQPDGSAVTVTPGQPEVLIYTSNPIAILPNSGGAINFNGTLTDSAPGYLMCDVMLVNADTGVNISSMGKVLVYGTGVISSSASAQNTSGSSTLNVVVKIFASAFFAATTGRVTAASSRFVSLYPAEVMGPMTIPDNNSSYPGYGVVVTGASNTSTWFNIYSDTTPAGNLVSFFGVPLLFNQEGTAPVFEYQILVGGVVVESFDMNMVDTSTSGQFGVRYCVETSAPTLIQIRVRCKTAGGAGSILGHSGMWHIRLDLDKIGAYVKYRYDEATTLTTNPMFQTPVLSTTPGHSILNVMAYSTWASSSIYRSVSYNGSTINPVDMFTGSNISTGASLDFNNRTPNGSNVRGDFYYEINTQGGSTTGDLRLVNSSTWYNQTMRPGSSAWLFDLSADIAPPEEYDPINYLEIS